MLTEITKRMLSAFLLLIVFTIITGFIYPAIITGIAQLFPWQANGSFLQKDNKIIGSLLIGQSFTDAKYFVGRPSATTPNPYNAQNSSGSNLGPTNPDFLKTVQQRAHTLSAINPQMLIPVDLVTASGSGLDPDISPLSAYYQVPRIAHARNLSEVQVIQLIQQITQHRTLGFLGERRVNVLQLNLALDNSLNIKAP